MLLFLKEMKKRFIEDKVFDLSAQLAYYFLVSLFPFLFLLFTILGFLPISEEYVLSLIQPFAPEQVFHLIEYNINAVLNNRRGDIISISILVTVWLASIGIHAIIRVFNQAYQVDETRPFLKELILGVFLTLGLVIAIVTSLLLPMFGKGIGLFLVEQYGLAHPVFHVWNITRWLLSFIIFMVMFICLYVIAPNIKLSILSVFPGALFATLGWQLISLVFSFYVSFFDYRQIYGNLGVLLTLMIWFYLSAMIMIIGGQMNAAWLALKKGPAKKSNLS